MLLSSIFVVGSCVSNTTFRDTCTKAVTEVQCHGKAPTCMASASDCSGDWKYDRDVKGDPCGSNCWTGHKVVCTKCTPCVATADITGSWQKMAAQPGGTTLELTAGWKKGEEHTRSETWGQEVTVAAEASMSVKDVFSMKRSISATFTHSLTQTDKTYWESSASTTIDFTFDSYGIVYQWAYTIDDGCGERTTYSASYHLTKKGPPCCIPEDFVDPDSPETSECIQGPNLCLESHETTVAPTTQKPEPASPEQCPAGADFMCVGTAPSCGGETSDCEGDWKFLEWVNGGEHHGQDCGSKCWTGKKVVCFRCLPAPAPTPAPTTETTTTTSTTPAVTDITVTTTTTTTTLAPEPETTFPPDTTGVTTHTPTTTGVTTHTPATTVGPETTLPPVTTDSPVTPSPQSCQACLTTCAPCQDCLDGRDATFPFGSCEKCWQCWDWDDDELEDDDDHMDKDCDAMHKNHDWNDEEVRCLTDKVALDCRACWASPQNIFV